MKTTTLLLTLFTTLTVAQTPKKLSTALNLQVTYSPWTGLAKDLSDALPIVKVSTLLSSADHTMPASSPSSPLVKQLKWTPTDGATKAWYPQGITTSADAYETGVYDGKEVILASWYDKAKGGPKGVRIAFVDPKTKKYVYVLLVEPEKGADGKPSYHALKGLHAGGIAWYGDMLYVVDTSGGLRLFDVSKILKVTKGNGIGLVGGKYYAHGYKYIIPQVARYKPTSKGFHFSYIGLDRTTKPDSIVVGEYQLDKKTARIARFDIDYKTRFLVHAPKRANTAVRREMWQIGATSLQGVVSANGKYYFTKSHGANGKSDLLTWSGKKGSSLKSHGRVLPPGAEDLSYKKGELWSLAEHPGKRSMYAVKASRF